MKRPNKQLIAKFNELYIQTRKKYLVQFPDRYVTLNQDRMANVIKLNDSMLKTHLDGKLTYGIFSGGYFNKFITFDVDCDEETMARWATLKLVHMLEEDYQINRNDIHVSVSGGKGFHVDLFFDKPVLVAELKKFHYNVITNVGIIPNGKIEFRASWSQGVKLPLGVHQKTGRRCWFVDNETLEPFEGFDYLLNVEPMSAEVVTANDFGLTDEQVEEFEFIAQSTDINANTVDLSKALQSARRILEANRLTESHTRHNVTFQIAKFCHDQGFEELDAVAKIMEILTNTPRDYFHKDSTPEFWHKEAQRLTRLVFEKGYTLGNADKPITIYKSEILAVLQASTFRTKQVLYAMIITSKRYGRTFYFTESTALQMVGTKSKKTIGDALKRLYDSGVFEYVRKGEVDTAKSHEIGQFRYKRNKYRLLIEPPGIDEPSVEVKADQSVVEVAQILCEPSEIKKHVKRYEYKNNWALNS